MLVESVCQLPPLWSYPPFRAFIPSSLQGNHRVQPTCRGLCSTSWREENLCTYLKLSALEICLFSTVYRLIQPFVYIWTDSEYVVYTLSYNPILVCFVAQVIVTLAIGNPFTRFPCPFNMAFTLWLFVFWALPHFEALSDDPDSRPRYRTIHLL